MFKYRIWNGNGECRANRYSKFSNHLCGAISNSHRDSINRWWNLLVGTGWANYFKHYCVTCFHNNLYCHL